MTTPTGADGEGPPLLLDLELTAGEPFARQIVVPQGLVDWPAPAVWAQARRGRFRTAPLLLDLTPYLTLQANEDQDLVLELALPASATAPLTRSGDWDGWLGDVDDGGRAVQVVAGKFHVTRAVSVRPAQPVGLSAPEAP